MNPIWHGRGIATWFAIGVLALISIEIHAKASFVGSNTCVECHEEASSKWRGSHHDLAMAAASSDSVLGDFDNAEFTAHGVTSRFFIRDGEYVVNTDGPDGELRDYRISHTFGWYPLQQYLVDFHDGRLQALGIAWDSRPASEGGQRWFHLYPDQHMDHDDPLHWTGREQTWNYQCAECHSTDLKKGYAAGSDTYDTRFAEIDVACEACHGPASGHLQWAAEASSDEARSDDSLKGLIVDLSDRDGGSWQIDAESLKPYRSTPRTRQTQIEICARCHSRRGLIHADYEYGQPIGNTHRVALLDRHLYFPDGQIRDEVFVYGSFLQSKMYRAGVTCTDCHDAHSLELHATGNALCTRCHTAAKYDQPAHHQHDLESPAAACTACHMPQRTYMVIDDRADHSLRIPRPDLSARIGTPNACNGCHQDRTSDWAAAAVAQWFPDSKYRGSHFSEALHAATIGDPTAASQLVAIAADGAQAGIVRATAVDRLRPLAGAQHLEMIGDAIESDDPLIRAAAVRFLEVTEVQTRVDLGWSSLDDTDRVVRLEAARILAPLLRQRVPERFRETLLQAVADYRAAQMANAERPESHLNIGLIAVAAGDPVAAEQAYRTALRIDPRFVGGYVNLADLYRLLQRDKEGEQLLRAGIDKVPDDADMPHALGLLLVRQKRMEEALVYLQRAAETATDDPRMAYVYGLALQGAGDLGQARMVLMENSRRHPEHAATRAALSEIEVE
jgi:hypothetical protein